jgi:hypothetical protein
MGIKDLVNVGVAAASAAAASTAKSVVAAETTPPVEQAVAPATEQKPVEQAPPKKQVEPPAVSNETIVANNNIDITTKQIPKEDSKADGASKETTQSTEAKTEKSLLTGIVATAAAAGDEIGGFLSNEFFKVAQTFTSLTGSMQGIDSQIKLRNKIKDDITTIKVDPEKLAKERPEFEPRIGKFSTASVNNTQKEPPKESSANRYTQWDMKIDEKDPTVIIIKDINGKESRVKKKSAEEAKFVKETIKPTGVDFYETGQVGHSLILATLQDRQLTGRGVDDIATAMIYDPKTGSAGMSLVNKNGERKDYMLTHQQLERGMTDRYGNTIAVSNSYQHQRLNALQDLTLRNWAQQNIPYLIDSDPHDANNLLVASYGDNIMQRALNPGKIGVEYVVDKDNNIVKVEPGKLPTRDMLERRFSSEQLAKIRRKVPDANIIVSMHSGDNKNPNDVIRKSGLYSNHAYTLIDVAPDGTLLVVDPRDSSKILRITDKTNFIEMVTVQNL